MKQIILETWNLLYIVNILNSLKKYLKSDHNIKLHKLYKLNKPSRLFETPLTMERKSNRSSNPAKR